MPAVILFLANLVAHFLPFERASRSLDDLGAFVAVLGVEAGSMGQFLLHEMAQDAGRPLA